MDTVDRRSPDAGEGCSPQCIVHQMAFSHRDTLEMDWTQIPSTQSCTFTTHFKMVLAQPQNQHVTKAFDLTGKVAIVTGGARGIGLEVSRGLAEAGANVWSLLYHHIGKDWFSRRWLWSTIHPRRPMPPQLRSRPATTCDYKTYLYIPLQLKLFLSNSLVRPFGLCG